MTMDTTTAPAVVREFFTAGYVNHDYGRVMDLVAQDYVDHSPVGARSNADAVGILRIVEGMFGFIHSCRKIEERTLASHSLAAEHVSNVSGA
ncbi:MAG: nuclear transport factor 2 family protein [Bifidobacterium castoris]|nr:nuclear transport factor 2 family protein [Bifidobacterium castoris]